MNPVMITNTHVIPSTNSNPTYNIGTPPTMYQYSNHGVPMQGNSHFVQAPPTSQMYPGSVHVNPQRQHFQPAFLKTTGSIPSAPAM